MEVLRYGLAILVYHRPCKLFPLNCNPLVEMTWDAASLWSSGPPISSACGTARRWSSASRERAWRPPPKRNARRRRPGRRPQRLLCPQKHRPRGIHLRHHLQRKLPGRTHRPSRVQASDQQQNPESRIQISAAAAAQSRIQ
jgi:hypothetical protein